MTPGDLTYPEHLAIGTGKYLQSAMQRQPDFSGVNQMFSTLGSMGPLVRGGTFYDPEQAKEMATPNYLQARGNIAQNNIANMFQLAQLANQSGALRGQIAQMIPELQAQQVQLGSTGLFGGLF